MGNVRNLQMNKKRILVRGIIAILLLLLPLLYISDFVEHFYFHLSGSILPNVITDQWLIVVINIVIFMTFLIPISFRRKIDWKEYGLITAFFVSLFVEMYGIPLTVYFASNLFSTTSTEAPNIIYEFGLFGQDIKMTMAMVYGTLLMVVGTIIIMIAWVTLYQNLQSVDIVTSGIYSYSRHPQYLGFILIIIGWLVGWPTILTLIFAPILIILYIRISRIEEAELEGSENYRKYKERVPFFI